MRMVAAALALIAVFLAGQVTAQAPGNTAPAGAAPAGARAAGQARLAPNSDYPQRLRIFGTDMAPVEPFRIVGNVYYVGSENQGIYLITTPQGHILLDAGPSILQASIFPNIVKLGFKISDIKILLVTHAHVDHVQGLAYAQRATEKAVIMAMEADVKALESGKDLSTIGIEGWEPVRVDRVLHDNEEVMLGGTTLRAIWAPGHTPGNTTWIMNTQDGGRNYTIAFGGAPTPVVGNPKFDTREEDALTSFRRLKEISVDMMLPGHPRETFAGKLEAMRAGTRPHPLLMPAGAWSRLINDAEAAYRQRLAAARTAQ